MMIAQELRIGNLVEYFGKNLKIDTIKRCSDGNFAVEICEKRPSGCSWSEYAPIESPSLKPIPLTGEWLVKLGFEQMYFLGAKIRYFIKGNLMYSTIDRHVEYKNGSINFIIRKCEYVHDLQNLYQAMTGEELTLKTNP